MERVENMLFCSVFGFVVESHFGSKSPWNMFNAFFLDIFFDIQ